MNWIEIFFDVVSNTVYKAQINSFCLFVWGFSSDIETLLGEGLQIVICARHSWTTATDLSRKTR